MAAATTGEGQGTSSTPPEGDSNVRHGRDQREHDQRVAPVTSFRRRAVIVITASVAAIAVGSLVGSVLSALPNLQNLAFASYLERAERIAAIELIFAVPLLSVVLLMLRRSRSVGTADKLAPYGILSVSDVDPAEYVPLYYKDLYERRMDKGPGGVEAAAQQALRWVANASGLNLPRLPLGICIFGPRLQGKTRLAWETVRRELPDWTFLAWPHRFNHQWQLVDRVGTQVVIWLDELQTYTTPWEIAALDELFARLRVKGVRFVVVATCRGPGAPGGRTNTTGDSNAEQGLVASTGSATNDQFTALLTGGQTPADAASDDAPGPENSKDPVGASEGAVAFVDNPSDDSDGDELTEDDELTVRVALGPLVDQLAPIRLSDLREPEEEHLRRAYREKFGKDVVVTVPGRRPGAIVLDIEGMKQVYNGVKESFAPEGRYVLQGLKLLRFAGIYSYPWRRVRMAAIEYNLSSNQSAWNTGCDEVKRKRFVRVKSESTSPSRWNVLAWFGKPTMRERDEVIEPMSVVYLESVVLDREVALTQLPLAWPNLRARLTAERDAEGLIYLGQKLLTTPTGDARTNQREAALCFESALQGRVGDLAIAYVPDARAAAYCGKGDALYAGAEHVVEGAMAEAFGRAADAYAKAIDEASSRDPATTSRPRPVPPRMLAYAYRGNGRALIGRANALETAAPEMKRGSTHSHAPGIRASLKGAIDAYQKARELYEAQQEIDATRDLAEVLIELAGAHVEIAEWYADEPGASDQAASHVHDAIENYERALHLYPDHSSPMVWAMIQERIADAERELASHVGYAQALQRYERAARAYRLAESVYTPQIAPSDWARLEERLGETLFRHAQILANGPVAGGSSGSMGTANRGAPVDADKVLEKQVKLLLEAAEADESALRDIHQERTPLRWAALNYHLARIYYRLAEIRAVQERPSDARAFLVKAKDHNDRAWTMDNFEFVDDAQKLRRSIALLLTP